MEINDSSEFSEWNRIFEVLEIRALVGNFEGIRYIIHTNEQGKHNKPHLHAKYQEQEVVIEIPSGIVLRGNIPPSKQKQASHWVIDHNDFLIEHWNELSNGMKMNQFGLIVSSEYSEILAQ